MATWSKVSDSPSCAMASTSLASPYFVPVRDLLSRCGAWVIDSWPPATMTSNSPARMSWSASAIALSPDRHTLLMVRAGTFERGLDRESTELDSREVLELTEQPPHRGAGAGHDDRTGHGANLRRRVIRAYAATLPRAAPFTRR